MFLYSSRPFDLLNAATLARIARIVDTVGDRTVDRTERYADDRVAGSAALAAGTSPLGERMAANTVARQGRRLQRGVPLVGGLIIVAVIAVWLLNILPALARF